MRHAFKGQLVMTATVFVLIALSTRSHEVLICSQPLANSSRLLAGHGPGI